MPPSFATAGRAVLTVGHVVGLRVALFSQNVVREAKNAARGVECAHSLNDVVIEACRLRRDIDTTFDTRTTCVLRLVSTKVATAVFGLSKYQVYYLRRRCVCRRSACAVVCASVGRSVSCALSRRVTDVHANFGAVSRL